MRRSLVALATVAVFGLGWSAGQVFSQDMGGGEKKPAGGGAAEGGGPSPEEMDAMMKAATPGEEHKRMGELEGQWSVAGKFWMDPKAPPTETTGVATFRMILGGRYQVQEYKSEFMGMPFEGMGISAFDNVAKEHVNTWMDNMGTGIMLMKGKADASGKMTASGDCLGCTGEKMSMREVWTFKGKDSHVFEMFCKDSKHPEEFKCMELTYTRKK